MIPYSPPGHGQGASLCAPMGKRARDAPMAGWRAWERRTVLGQIDREGRRDNPYDYSARMRIILKNSHQ